MKRLIATLLCAMLLTGSFAGCSLIEQPSSEVPSQSEESEIPEEGTPAAAAARFLNAVSALDRDEITATVSNMEEDDWLNFPKNPDATEQAAIDLAEAYLGRMTYTLGKTTLNDDTAMVAVDITVPDLTGVMNDIIGEVVKQAALSALSGKEPDIEAMAVELIAKVDVASLSLVTTGTVIPLAEQPDGTWLVDGDSAGMEDLANAISGGVAEKMEAYSGQLESLMK